MVEFFSVAMFVISCNMSTLDLEPSLKRNKTASMDQFLLAIDFYFSTNSKFALEFLHFCIFTKNNDGLNLLYVSLIVISFIIQP